MGGTVVIIIVLVVVAPVVTLMSMGILAAALGGILKSEVDAKFEGHELLGLSESGKAVPDD